MRSFAAAVVLLAITLAVFGRVADHDFLQFDDADYVTENPQVREGVTWAGIRWASSTPHAGNWHPLTWVSHMLDVELFGLDAGRHLLVNTGLHAATCVILFFLLKGMTRRPGASFVVSALFAIHPLHVESVAWVAERKDVLSTFWWALAVAAYVRAAGRTDRATLVQLGPALACFGLALLSKPMVVTLPFVLMLLDVWPLGRGVRVKEKTPFLLLAAIVSVVTFLVQREAGAVQSAEAFPWSLRLANMPVAYVTYLTKTVWPVDLVALYPYPDTIPFWKSALATLLLCGMTFGAWRHRRTRPYLLSGWIWFVVTLAPVIGLIQVGSQPYADRYMYVPSIGLFLAIAWLGADVLGRSPAATRIAAGLATVLIAGLALVAYRQVGVWRNSLTLWEHTVSVTPDNYRAQTNLGFARARARDLGGAEAAYRQALQIRPGFAAAHNYLGAVLSERGDHAAAETQLRAALASRPRFVEAHNNLGLALASLGRPADAIGAFREAVRLNPAFAPAWNNLGIALAQVGQFQGAVEAFAQSVRLQPRSAEAQFNLGTALLDSGRRAEARQHFEAALSIDPGFAAAREALRKNN